MSQPSFVTPGWEELFREIMVFLEDINRHADSPNESYCEYVVQRLEFSISNMSILADHLGSRPPLVTLPQIRIAKRFADYLTEFVDCLIQLHDEWLNRGLGFNRQLAGLSRSGGYQDRNCQHSGSSVRFNMVYLPGSDVIKVAKTSRSLIIC